MIFCRKNKSLIMLTSIMLTFALIIAFFPVRATATSSKELKSMSRELDEIPEEFRTNEIIVSIRVK